jgi:hypothetical protein
MPKQQSEEQGQQDMPNPIQIQKFLKGIDYPVDRDELIDRAEENGADEAVLEALANMPEGEYDSPTAVSRELTKANES